MTHTHSEPTHSHRIMVDRDEEQLRLLGIFHLVMAGFTLLTLILFVLVPLVMGPAIFQVTGVRLSPGGQAAAQERLIGGLMVFSLLTFIFALNGWSLKKREHRLSCMILSCIECLSFIYVGPIGLMLGISSILVLRRESVKPLFKQGEP